MRNLRESCLQCDNCWPLTHWGRVTHICVSKLPTIGSDNGLSPGRRQAIIWTNAGILLFGPLGSNFSEIEIDTFSFKKMHLKLSSAKWRPFCLGLNVLIITVSGKITEMRNLTESCLQRDDCWPLIVTVSGKITEMRNLTESCLQRDNCWPVRPHKSTYVSYYVQSIRGSLILLYSVI